MVKYWMHTGFLNVSGEKMSKSLGNFITIRDLLENYDGEIFRFFVLSTHYRSPIDFSEKALDQAGNSLSRIKKLLVRIKELDGDELEDDIRDDVFQKLLNNARNDFFEAMDNDFNTPQGLAAIFNLIKELNKLFKENIPSKSVLSEILSFFNDLSEILGIDFNQTPKTSENNHCNDLLDLILDLRVTLREKKEWDLSDQIRSELRNLGIEIEDK